MEALTYPLHVALVVEDCNLHLGLLALDHVVREVQRDEERFEYTKLEKNKHKYHILKCTIGRQGHFFSFSCSFRKIGQNNMLGLAPPV